MTDRLPLTAVPSPTYRLIPSRFPPVSAFADVASPQDLEAVMELEGWTNDRLVRHRLARLPQADWTFGVPNASVVMAAFLHAAPAGQRFSGADLGAWYAGYALTTAVVEVAHHLKREMVNAGWDEMRGQYRAYLADLAGDDYVDLRRADRPELAAPADYAASQAFGEAARAAGSSGVVYHSLRHAGGSNVVCYRPRQIGNVLQAAHYEIVVRPVGKIIARELTA